MTHTAPTRTYDYFSLFANRDTTLLTYAELCRIIWEDTIRREKTSADYDRTRLLHARSSCTYVANVTRHCEQVYCERGLGNVSSRQANTHQPSRLQQIYGGSQRKQIKNVGSFNRRKTFSVATMSLVNWNLLSDTASMLLPVASVHNVRNVCQLRYVCPVAQSSGRKSVDMTTTTCNYCNEKFEAERKTRKFCSQSCLRKSYRGTPKERNCRQCEKVFQVLTRGDANRQYCSQRCSKKANAKKIRGWTDEHPDAMKQYNANRTSKNPRVWSEKWNKDRTSIISLLGGKCIVCGATNPFWLHVDYIPTTRNKLHRHPRHLAYISRYKEDFRLLCANHHYELTLTGMIEGTDITQ